MNRGAHNSRLHSVLKTPMTREFLEEYGKYPYTYKTGFMGLTWVYDHLGGDLGYVSIFS